MCVNITRIVVRLRFLIDHFLTGWKWYTGILAILYLFYKVGGPLGEILSEWIRKHSTVQNGSVVEDAWIKAVAAAVSLALFALIVLAVFTLVSLYKARKAAEGAEKTPILVKTFRRTTQAASLISKRLFPGADQSIKKVVSCKQIYAIYENGDCHFFEKLVVCAKERDIHFIEKGLDADPEADSVEYPDEINLKLESKTEGKDIAYLISRNEPRSKGVVAFFLPLIARGEADRRELETTYYWRGLFRRLVTRGQEDFEMQVRSVEPVPHIEYQFWVKPQMGRLLCTHIGEYLGEDRESLKGETGQNGMQGWVYLGKDLPKTHTTMLRLELKKA